MTFRAELLSVLALFVILAAGWIGCMAVTWRRDNRKLRQGRLEFHKGMRS